MSKENKKQTNEDKIINYIQDLRETPEAVISTALSEGMEYKVICAALVVLLTDEEYEPQSGNVDLPGLQKSKAGVCLELLNFIQSALRFMRDVDPDSCERALKGMLGSTSNVVRVEAFMFLADFNQDQRFNHLLHNAVQKLAEEEEPTGG